MDNKQNGLMVLVALVAGLIGGVSSWWLRDSPAFAQKFSEPARIIQAERFEVVDKDGKRRAALGLEFDGRPSLRLIDKDGKGRTALSLGPDGTPVLRLADKSGKSRALLSLGPDGAPGLGLVDRGEVRAMLGLAPDGRPSLRLIDKDGKGGVVLDVVFAKTKAAYVGGPGLQIIDKHGIGRAMLFVDADGVPGLALTDKDREVRTLLT